MRYETKIDDLDRYENSPRSLHVQWTMIQGMVELIKDIPVA